MKEEYKFTMSDEYKTQARIRTKQYLIEVLSSMPPDDITEFICAFSELIGYDPTITQVVNDLGTKLEKDYPEELAMAGKILEQEEASLAELTKMSMGYAPPADDIDISNISLAVGDKYRGPWVNMGPEIYDYEIIKIENEELSYIIDPPLFGKVAECHCPVPAFKRAIADGILEKL